MVNIYRFFKNIFEYRGLGLFNRTDKAQHATAKEEKILAEQGGASKIDGRVLTTKKGDFRLEVFGEGGICQVFKGTPINQDKKPSLEQVILVKRIHPKWYEHAHVLQQFKREISIVRDFIHPQLPQYVDSGTLGGQDYLAYKYIEGVPLIELPKYKSKYPPEFVRELAPFILWQLLNQLKHLHENMSTIVHGDISIENIIYGEENKIYLVDFGCAYRKYKVTDDNYHWLGKPSYISPEQARGETWDEKSDVYQAGILFYELVSGQRWNKGSDPREKMLFSANATSPEPDFLSQWVDLPLSSLIAEMMIADQHKRLASIQACQTRLKPFVVKFK